MNFQIALWLTGGAVGTTAGLIAFYPLFCTPRLYVRTEEINLVRAELQDAQSTGEVTVRRASSRLAA